MTVKKRKRTLAVKFRDVRTKSPLDGNIRDYESSGKQFARIESNKVESRDGWLRKRTEVLTLVVASR